MSWEDLRRIAEDSACSDACAELQSSVESGDEEKAREAVRKFGSKLAPLLKGKIKQPVPWWIWALGPIVLKFGAPADAILGEAISIGQFAERSLVWGLNKLRDRVIAARVVDSTKSVGLFRKFLRR